MILNTVYLEQGWAESHDDQVYREGTNDPGSLIRSIDQLD